MVVKDAKARRLGEFLKFKRSQFVPVDVGLPDTGNRRVAGLRRDEVAAQASISTEHYIRIEQGRRNASSDVLEAIAEVLRFSSDEREYVLELSRTNGIPSLPRRGDLSETVEIPAGVKQLMDAISAPALVHNGRFDVLTANTLGRALYADLLKRQPVRPNLARFLFLDPLSRDFLPEWDVVADRVINLLRWEYARSPVDDDLDSLIAEFESCGEEFTKRWEAHSVGSKGGKSKYIRHPVVGLISVNYSSLEILGSNGLILSTFTVEPDSPSEVAIKALAVWADAEGMRVKEPDS